MEIVNGCSDMHDIPILSQLKEFKAIFLWKIFPYHRNFSPKLIKVPVLLFDTLEYIRNNLGIINTLEPAIMKAWEGLSFDTPMTV